MKKRISARTSVLIIAAVAILIVAIVYASLPSPVSPFTNPPDNSSNNGTTKPTIVFDFDVGSPLLIEGQNTPFNQTANEITASFSSPSDFANPAFSIQSYDTTFFVLSQFSGKWLYDNKPSVDALDIVFSQPLTSINFTFATLEYHGGPTTEPTEIKLSAYLNSVETAPVGTTKSRGAFSTGLYPQGTLSFTSSEQPFNVVRIEIPYVPNGATDFFVDNIIVIKTQ